MLSVLVLFNACQDCNDCCPENATCIDNVCLCNEGYSGLNCEIFDNCINTSCPENAVCVDGVCVCEAGFAGINCEPIDSCSLMLCPENTSCVAGECICNLEGYEGAECDTEIRSKYLGTYSAEDICDSGVYQYTVNLVNANTSILDFIIEGFGGFAAPVLQIRCTIVNDTHFEIVSAAYPGIINIRSIPDLDGNHGIYNIETGQLNVSYEITFDNNIVEVCDLILTPQ